MSQPTALEAKRTQVLPPSVRTTGESWVSALLDTQCSAACDPVADVARSRIAGMLFGVARPTILLGYSLRETLGQGGMGVVFRAYDTGREREVALKLVNAGAGVHPALARRRLTREAQLLGRVEHPNVVGLIEHGTHDGRAYLAMELVEGQTLGAWLAEGPRSWPEQLAMFVQAGEGLHAVHEAGIVHRDFKPNNVMIGPDGRALLIDFGIATDGSGYEVREGPMPLQSLAALERPTCAGTLMGTPQYMAPEALDGHVPDARADQYAFCVSLWQALCGRHPFIDPADDPGAKTGSASVPRQLLAVLRRGMSLDPRWRWPSMDVLLKALRRIAVHVARRAGHGLRPRRSRRRARPPGGVAAKSRWAREPRHGRAGSVRRSSTSWRRPGSRCVVPRRYDAAACPPTASPSGALTVELPLPMPMP